MNVVLNFFKEAKYIIKATWNVELLGLKTEFFGLKMIWNVITDFFKAILNGLRKI